MRPEISDSLPILAELSEFTSWRTEKASSHACILCAEESSYYKEGMIEVDLLGKIYREYMIPGGQHHDFVELPDGNLLVASDSPDLSTVEDYVVEIDRETGAVVWELDMKDLISQEDGQSASMDSDGSEETDWFHNNGLAYDAENDLVLLLQDTKMPL